MAQAPNTHDSHIPPLKVAIFSGNYNYVMDGPVRALNKLVGFLESRNVIVRIFAPTAKKAAFQHTGELISVPSVALPGRGEYRVGLGLPSKQRQMLEDFAPDIVHLAAPDWLGHSALSWAQENGVPAISSFHTRFDTYPRYYKMAWLEKYVQNIMRRFYHRCERIYAPSHCMAKILTDQNMAKDIRIWSRGVDLQIFNPNKRDTEWRRSKNVKRDEVVIAFVGRLVLEKGLGVFADVLDELVRRGIRHKALIVGEGPERERFAKRLPNAIFTGYQSGEELARAYASSDIFFNASTTETFGNVTLEAMASRLPSVCADATGSRTLVTEGKSGYLVQHNDIGAFADRLQLLIENKSLRIRMAIAAETASHEYCWEKILSGMLAEYNDVVACAGKRLAQEAQLVAAE